MCVLMSYVFESNSIEARPKHTQYKNNNLIARTRPDSFNFFKTIQNRHKLESQTF